MLPRVHIAIFALALSGIACVSPPAVDGVNDVSQDDAGRGDVARDTVANADCPELVAHWKFEKIEADDTVSNVAGSSALDAVIHGGPVIVDGGASGNSMAFSRQDYLLVSHHESLELPEATFVMHVFFEEPPTRSMGLLTKDAYGKFSGHTRTAVDEQGVQWRVQDESNSHYYESGPLPVGKWVEIVQFVGKGSAAVMYVDGEEITPTYGSYFGGIDENDTPLVLGASSSGSTLGSDPPDDLSRFLKASLDEVAIFSTHFGTYEAFASAKKRCLGF